MVVITAIVLAVLWAVAVLSGAFYLARVVRLRDRQRPARNGGHGD